MAIFTISPVNSIQFVRRNTNAENFLNTLYHELSDPLAKTPYFQKVTNGETITIQIKTDYDSITATLYNINTGVSASLTPAEKSTYTDFSFWEIPVTISTNGQYKIFITATLSGGNAVSYESQLIEVASSWEGVKIEYYNDNNTIYVDYSTGIQHLVNVFGIVKFSDIGGKDELYNNRGTEERIYSENEAIEALTIENIPFYLARQIIFGSRLDHFIVNDVEYIVKEHTISEHNGNHAVDLILKMTEKYVEGINADYGYTGLSGTATADSTVITVDDTVHTGDET